MSNTSTKEPDGVALLSSPASLVTKQAGGDAEQLRLLSKESISEWMPEEKDEISLEPTLPVLGVESLKIPPNRAFNIASMIKEQRSALEEQRKLLKRMEEMQFQLEQLARVTKAHGKSSMKAPTSLGSLSREMDRFSTSQSAHTNLATEECENPVEVGRRKSLSSNSTNLNGTEEVLSSRKTVSPDLKKSSTVANIQKQFLVNEPTLRDVNCAIVGNQDVLMDNRRRTSIHGLAARDLQSALANPTAAPQQSAKVVPSGNTDDESMKSSNILEGSFKKRRASVRGRHFEGLENLRLQIESGYRIVITDEEDSTVGSDQDDDEEYSDNEHADQSKYGIRSSTGNIPLVSGGADYNLTGNTTGGTRESGELDPMSESESKLRSFESRKRKQTSSYDDHALSAIGDSMLASGKQRPLPRQSQKYKDSQVMKAPKRDLCWSLIARFVTKLPIIHPESSFRANWNLFVLVMLLWYSFSIPFSISFSIAPFGIWKHIETVFNIAFGIDILLNFITGYYSTRQSVKLIVMNHRMIVRNYMATWLFVDLIAIVPFDRIVTAVTDGQISSTERSFASLSKLIRLLKLTRLLRLVGLYRYFRIWSERMKPGMLRLMTSLVVGLLVIHLLACFFYYISDLDPTRVDTWSDVYGVRETDSAHPKYLASLYWSITTMTTVGYGDIVPQNESEILFVIFAMLVSCSMFAYSVGNVASMVSALDSTQVLYKEKMDWLKEYCAQQDLPLELQSRIREYYSNCWKDLKSFPFSEHAILDDLSPALRREVVLFLNKDMVAKVPFFEGQDDNFICRLILSMTAEVCAPLDMIIRQGEVGKAMYFVRRGLVEVCNANATEIYTTLSDGCYFGEISLLVGGRRTASVRAIFHSSLFRLEQEDLDELLMDYPVALQKILQLAATSRYHLTETEHDSLQKRFEVFSAIMNPDDIDDVDSRDGFPSEEASTLHSRRSSSKVDLSEPLGRGLMDRAQSYHSVQELVEDVASESNSSTHDSGLDEDGFHNETDYFPTSLPTRTVSERPFMPTYPSSRASTKSLDRMDSRIHVPLGAAVLERVQSVSPQNFRKNISPSTPKDQ